MRLLSLFGLCALLFTIGCDPPPDDEEPRRRRDEEPGEGEGEPGEGEGEGEAPPVGPPLTMRLSWTGSTATARADLDVRGVKRGTDGRFCVDTGFFPNGVPTTGARAQICTPSTDCSFDNCQAGDPLPDWNASGTVDNGDPRIDRDDTNGPGPEILSVPGLANGEYLFGALFFSGSRGERATLQGSIGAVSRTTTTRLVVKTWTELFIVRVVNGVGTIESLAVTPAPCVTSTTCLVGEQCNASGVCVAGCTADTDCGAAEFCDTDGTCADGCREDLDCAADEFCDVGNGHVCAPGCGTNADCDATEVCTDNVCVTPAPPSGLSGTPINVELTWIGSQTDLDVRGIRKDSSGRFCVSDRFLPNNATVGAGQLVQECTPAVVPSTTVASGGDCTFSNCRGTTARLPDWDLSGANSVGDPRIDVDDTRGFGPENLTIPGGLLDGEYLFGAVVFGSSRGDKATLRVSENGVQRVSQTANVKPSSWTELAIVRVVNRVVTVTAITPPAFACVSNTQCPIEHVCTAATGQCTPGCTSSTDCTGTEVCEANACVVATNQPFEAACEVTAECATGLVCVDDTFGGTCGEACTTAAECELCSAALGRACTCGATGNCE